MDLMLNELQRKRLWENWLEAEMRSGYFAELAWIYRQRQQWATWATLLLSSGAVAALIKDLPQGWHWLPTSLVALTAAVSLYLVVQQNYRRGDEAAELHLGWRGLALDCQRLWESGMYADDAITRLDALEDRAAPLSKAGTGFPASERRLKKWWQRVVEEHRVPAHA
jgi:hypothetical protein